MGIFDHADNTQNHHGTQQIGKNADN